MASEKGFHCIVRVNHNILSKTSKTRYTEHTSDWYVYILYRLLKSYLHWQFTYWTRTPADLRFTVLFVLWFLIACQQSSISCYHVRKVWAIIPLSGQNQDIMGTCTGLPLTQDIKIPWHIPDLSRFFPDHSWSNNQKLTHVCISMIIYLNNHGVHACICFK